MYQMTPNIGGYFMYYKASGERYHTMQYNRCGKSGLLLPAVSLGLWHNFGTNDVFETMRQMCFTAFDSGITHFDLANNYGPLPRFCRIQFRKDSCRGFKAIPG